MKTQTKLKLITVWIAFAAAYSMLGSGRAHAADTGACYTIQDADARAVCLARANHRPDICYNIQRADMRSQCLAEVRK